MLFKRKSGKENSKGSRVTRPEDEVSRLEERVPEDTNAEQDWDREARQEVSSLIKESNKTEKLKDTRRAVSQRRVTKKLASIDWDIAAREEITALLGGNSGGADSQPGADNDLEAVRKAIARRKAKGPGGDSSNGLQAVPPANSVSNLSSPLSDEEKKGPRLDWLVDFISDDPAPGESNPNQGEKVNSPPIPGQPNKSSESSSKNNVMLPGEKSNAEQRHEVSGDKPRLKPRPDEIEIVPGETENAQGIFSSESTIGDGYGNLNIPNDSFSQLDIIKGNQVNRATPASRKVDDKAKEGTEEASTSKSHGVKNTSLPAGKAPIREKSKPSDKGATSGNKSKALDLDSLRTKDRVVGLLLRKQVVTMSQVYQAQKIKERENLKDTLWRILVELSEVDKDAIYEEAARIYAFPIADVEGKLDAKFVRSVMETLSDENRDRLLNLHLVPYECESEDKSGGVKLAFITHDPMRAEVRRVLKELKLDRFDLYYAPQSAVKNIIVEAFPRKNEYLERMTEDPMAFDLGMSYEEADIIDEDALEAEISRSSLINLFEATLVEGVRQGASDVHIYPNAKKKVEIHFRVDGRLTLWHTEHKVHPEALLAVIKDNAMNVDRFERDAAQDGYIQRWIDDVLIRFRVSVLPIANISHEIRSESIVIRILDDRKVIRDLRKLGLLDEAMKKFEMAITQPHGMVILTGPTGSGKSTTLVAALHQVITGEVNVLTVEDPVEYIIPGVRQIKLNYKLELENALRAILRHDPDVVMVGEMRDRKTAELAIKLANTGHLTFSTLHTNDAPSAISRLYKMGIEPFLIAYAINLIVAQRLIRKLCTNCKQPDLDPDPVMLEKLGFTKEEISNTTFYVPGQDQECPVCKGVGYKGRRAVSEALYFSREVRHMIVEADKMIDEGAIKDQAVKEGMMTLRDSAREIVKLGQTSVREMIRVVTTQG